MLGRVVLDAELCSCGDTGEPARSVTMIEVFIPTDDRSVFDPGPITVEFSFLLNAWRLFCLWSTVPERDFMMTELSLEVLPAPPASFLGEEASVKGDATSVSFLESNWRIGSLSGMEIASTEGCLSEELFKILLLCNPTLLLVELFLLIGTELDPTGTTDILSGSFSKLSKLRCLPEALTCLWYSM